MWNCICKLDYSLMCFHNLHYDFKSQPMFCFSRLFLRTGNIFAAVQCV